MKESSNLLFDLVLFGGTGDLAMRKLLPALATQAAHAATLHSFSHLKQQMLAAEKNPSFMKHLPATDPKA